jgi:hypothetical protein
MKTGTGISRERATTGTAIVAAHLGLAQHPSRLVGCWAFWGLPRFLLRVSNTGCIWTARG